LLLCLLQAATRNDLPQKGKTTASKKNNRWNKTPVTENRKQTQAAYRTVPLAERQAEAFQSPDTRYLYFLSEKTSPHRQKTIPHSFCLRF
jgi:hypothetical protein